MGLNTSISLESIATAEGVKINGCKESGCIGCNIPTFSDSMREPKELENNKCPYFKKKL